MEQHNTQSLDVLSCNKRYTPKNKGATVRFQYLHVYVLNIFWFFMEPKVVLLWHHSHNILEAPFFLGG